MKAIVTGATGFLGSHLVKYLENQGYQILALGRNKDKGLKLNSSQTRFKVVDLTLGSHVINAFETADVIFHCAAFSSAWGQAQQFYLANVEATRHVLNAAEYYNVKRCVYVSSTSVYFDFTDKFNIKENQVLTSGFVNEYAKTKYLGEQVMLNECRNTEVVIIRPRGIIGEGDTSIFPRILALLNKGVFPLLNQGQALVDITYVKNVAHALFLAGSKPDLHQQCFNISNAQSMNVKTLIDTLIKHTNKSITFLPVAYPLLYGLAGTLESFAKIFNTKEPLLTCYATGLLAKSQTLDISAANNMLGYQPLYSLEHGIKQYFTSGSPC
ncbi:NAD-dependent epimerase/dehydratase family protein [Shewanella surugensis]|uniref:NAD(P)-dependent oxidoreductase n=1 Tax=Shewanella surugensis TaxID=212020 RepID=A0ABT0L7G5_9GAMM|nr:NAD(P)-dependent oxidoreductase [Shewanella surugensis]MCL1123435.1 NAD(P)-dependent oxidoreductase [Shewanella surugensis]